MKTQTFGEARDNYDGTPPTLVPVCRRGYARAGRADYKFKRENGTDADNPDWKFPEDGKITWIKGRVKGEYVYGVKNKDGEYEYEVRYDEGTGDRKWMEEKDRRYLARLEKEGKLEQKEPEEYKRIMKQRWEEKLLAKLQMQKFIMEDKSGDKQSQVLLRLKSNGCVKKLVLEGLKLSKEVLKDLFELLKVNKTLQSVDISNCQLTD